MITFISEIKCQFSLCHIYVLVWYSWTLIMITELSVEKCGGYRWCVPSESTNAEYFVQWLFTLWKQIVMFNSCILMYTCTVRLMKGLGFYCFFLLNCYFYYPFLYKYLNCLIFMFENFMFCCLFSEIEEHFFSPLMYACFCCHFWRYYITQLNSTINLSNWCFD